MAENTLGRNIKFQIYNSDGTPFENLVLHKSTVESVVMSLGDKITGDVYYKNNHLEVTMREYIVYNDVKYTLVNPPTILREGLVKDNGDLKGMTKYSFEFYHPMYQLGNFPFSDVAVSSDQQRYLSENKKFSWIGYPDDYIAKLNKNLDGTEWVVEKTNRFPVLKDSQLSEVLAFDNNTVAEALKKFYETWEVPYVVSDVSPNESYYAQGKRFKVSFGLPSQKIYASESDRQLDRPFVFKMGQGVGLKNNSRTPSNNKIITRIAGYGSEDNIPYGYPQIPYEGIDVPYPLYDGIVGGRVVKLIKHPFTRTHLMPSIYRQTVKQKIYNQNVELKDYYDATGAPYTNLINPSAPCYEIHEFEDIKPEFGEEYIIDAQPINDSDKSVADEWDDTIDSDGNYNQGYFQITLPILSFDLYACAAITQEMQINMRGGACIGCTFTVQVDWDNYKANFYNQDGEFDPEGERRDYEKYPDSRQRSITVIVQKEYSTFGTIMPNVFQQPKNGDQFVFLGISMPSSYIEQAEQRLDDEMRSYMLENNTYHYEYPLKFDEYFLATHQYILEQLKPNSIVRFDFAGQELELFVKQTTIKYGESQLPQYNITLTDNIEIVLNQIGQVADDVEKLSSLVAILRQSYGRNVLVELSKKLSKVSDDTARGFIRFMKGLQVGEDFVSGLLGEGGVFRKDADGTTYLEADKMYVRMKAYFDTVEIRKFLHSGGNRIASVAGAKCVRVVPFAIYNGSEVALSDDYRYHWTTVDPDTGEEIQHQSAQYSDNPEATNHVEYYRCYFRGSDGDDAVTNDFIIGDQAYCHITNGDTQALMQHHYWRLVLNKSNSTDADGMHYIDLSNHTEDTLVIEGAEYKHAGFQTGSDVPLAQDDIVQLGNIADKTRQGAIIEYVSGEDSPSYQIYQGIDDFSLSGKNYIGIGYNSSTGRAYMNVYGDAYIGDRNRNAYMQYHIVNVPVIDPETGEQVIDEETGKPVYRQEPRLDIKARISVQSTVSDAEGGDQTFEEYINSRSVSKETIMKLIGDDLQAIQNQIDGAIETWFYNGAPSANTPPESEWKATDTEVGNNNERLKHLGDLYYDNKTGRAYRYVNTGTEQAPVFSWKEINDSAVVEALKKAQDAQSTADGKRRVFVAQPTPPYDKGDLWVNATFDNGTIKYDDDILKCVTAKDKNGSFAIADWALASKYTDDSSLNTFLNGQYKTDLQATRNQIDGKAETWYQSQDPSTAWTTDKLQESHVGDLWYNTTNKKTFIYRDMGASANPRYKWAEAEMDVPQEVFDKIDGKTSIYTNTLQNPPTNYKENDLWIIPADYNINGVEYKNGEVLTAIADSVGFNQAHWTKKVRYTDDTKFDGYINQILRGTGASGDSATVANAIKVIKNALNEATVIDGGLVLTSLINLRSNSKTWAGISGQYNEKEETQGGAKGHGIAAWYGGGMADWEKYKESHPTATITDAYAKSLFRFDGSGYLAGGNITWDALGRVAIKDITTLIGNSDTDILNGLTIFNKAFHFNTQQGDDVTVLSINPQAGFTNLSITSGGVLYPVATQQWVSDNYLSKAFFSRLFQAHNGATDVNPNDTATAITDIEAMFGFWTEKYISALGKNDSSSDVVLNEPLQSINNGVYGTKAAGTAIVWDGSKWVYGKTGSDGVDMNAVWTALNGSTGGKQFNTAWLTGVTKSLTITCGGMATEYNGTEEKAVNIDTELAKYLKLTGGAMSNTNLVTNMNADLLDGYHAHSFIRPIAAGDYNFNFADSTTTGGVYQVHAGNGTKNESWPFDYGLLANFVTENGHLQIATCNKNDIRIRSYWWTGSPSFGEYPEWQTLLHSGNIGNYTYSKGEVETKLAEVKDFVGQNYVSIAFFKRLFQPYKAGSPVAANEVNPNDTSSIIDNLKILVGTWTEQYISALGKGDGGSESVFDEAAMWNALKTAGAAHKIDNSHLNLGTLTISNGTTTLGTWTPTTNGTITISAGAGDRLAQYALAYGASVGSFTHTSDLIYTAKGGGNGCTDKPDGVDAFGVLAFKTADGYYGQVLMPAGRGRLYVRSSKSLDGTAWNEVALTSDLSAYTKTTSMRSLTIKGGTTDAVVYNPTDASAKTVTIKAGAGITVTGAANEITITRRELSASDIPNLDWSKITTGKPTTLADYGITDAKIADGVITLGGNSITPLTDAKIKSGYEWWGQKMGADGKVNGDVFIDMSTFDLSKSDNGVATTIWPGFRVRDNANRNSFQVINAVSANGTNAGRISVYNYNTSGTSVADKGMAIAVAKNGDCFISLDGSTTIGGNLTLAATSGTYIKIGSLYLVYDQNNNAIKVSASATGDAAANFYATGAVSALGISDSGSASTFDESQMWLALGTNISAKVIPQTHLNLTGYARTSDLNAYVKGVKVNGTTYSDKDANGVVDLGTISPDLSGYVTLATKQEISGEKTFKGAIAPNGGITPLAANTTTTPSGGGKVWFKKATSRTTAGDDTLEPNNGVIIEYGDSTAWTGQLFLGDNATQGLYWNGWYNGVRGEWKKFAFTDEIVSNIGNGSITNAMLAGSIENGKLKNSSVTVNGTEISLGGSNTTAKWGESRNINIASSDGTGASTSVSVDGSKAVTLKLPSAIKASLTGNVTGDVSGNAGTATKLQSKRKLWGNDFDGSSDVTGKINIGIQGSTSTATMLEAWTSVNSGISWAASFRNTYHVDSANGHGVGIRLTLGDQSESNKWWGIATVSTGSWENSKDLVFINNGTSEIEAVRIKNNGYVGVGTDSPAQKLDVSGNIHLTGDIYLNNTKHIYFRNAANSGDVNVLALDGSNQLFVGGNMTGAATYIRGKQIYLQSGTSSTTALSINENGLVEIVQNTQGLKIGNAYLVWDSANNALKVTGANNAAINFYATGGVSALGMGDSGSGGGVTLNEPLASINTSSLGSPSGHTNSTMVWNGSSWVWSNSQGTTLTSYAITGFSGSFTTGNFTSLTVGNKAVATQEWVINKYLPLSGGTMTGDIISKANGLAVRMDLDSANAKTGLAWYNANGDTFLGGIQFLNTSERLMLNATGVSDMWNDKLGNYTFIVGKNELKYNTYDVLHSGNYSTYIDKYVAKAGDTMTGGLTINHNNGTALSVNGAYSLSGVGTISGLNLTASASQGITFKGSSTGRALLGLDWYTNSAGTLTVSNSTDNSGIFSYGGFKKSGSSDSYVLLGGGGHKNISDFQTTVINNSFGGNGTAGYGITRTIAGKNYFGWQRVAVIQINSGWIDQLLTIHVIQRGNCEGDIKIKIGNRGYKDPNIESVIVEGNLMPVRLTRGTFYSDYNAIYYETPGRWELWVEKKEAYDNMSASVHERGKFTEYSMTVTFDTAWFDPSVGSTLPAEPTGHNADIYKNSSNAWRIGSASGYTYQYSITGTLTAKAEQTFTDGDGILKMYTASSTYGKETVCMQTCFDGQDPETSNYVTNYASRCVLALQPRGGRVGIGTTNPGYTLDVKGSAAISGLLTINGGEVTDDSKGIRINASDKSTRALIVYNGNTTSVDGAYLKIAATQGHIALMPGGNVGIGTTSPAYKLDVNGDTMVRGTLRILNSSVSTSFATIKVAKISGYSWVDVQGENGNNGIYNHGDFYCDGYATFEGGYGSSDIRKKDIVKYVERSVEDIARAPIFDFTWKQKPNKGTHLGTSAQYWQGILPNSVVTSPDGYLAMDYGAAALASAVSVARKVVDHELRIKQLQDRVIELENELKQLKAA